MVARNEEFAGGEYQRVVADESATKKIVDGVTFVVLVGAVVGLAVLDAKAAEKLAKAEARKERVEEENRRRELQAREIRLKNVYDSASADRQREIRDEYNASLGSDNATERQRAALRLKKIREDEEKTRLEDAEKERIAKIEAEKEAELERLEQIQKEEDQRYDERLDAQLEALY